jgi:hypothetical protein
MYVLNPVALRRKDDGSGDKRGPELVQGVSNVQMALGAVVPCKLVRSVSWSLKYLNI